MRSIISADNYADACVFASKEETRYYLGGAHIDTSGVMVATDGHALFGVKAQEIDWQFDSGRIIPANKDLLKACKAKPPAWAKSLPRYIAFEHDAATDMKVTAHLIVANGIDEARNYGRDNILYTCAVFDFIDGTFPDWTRVLPRLTDARPMVCPRINAELLLRFQSVAQGKEFRMVAHDYFEPTWVEMDRDDAFGVIMPMSGNKGPAKVPSWLEAIARAAYGNAYTDKPEAA
jgi:hypothetical protein